MRGKGNVKCVIVACVEDHPRLCGEKPKPCPRFQQPSGSPPPMRGKASPHSCRKSFPGITPAYAGKRKSSVHFTDAVWDHPRLCGEKKEAERKLNYDRGSPPPMRGKVNFFEFWFFCKCWGRRKQRSFGKNQMRTAF